MAIHTERTMELEGNKRANLAAPWPRARRPRGSQADNGPSCSPGRTQPQPDPAPAPERVPAPRGAGGCHWNMHLIGYLSAFLGGYKVQPLPEGIMGCNNETAGSFDAGPLTEEL